MSGSASKPKAQDNAEEWLSAAECCRAHRAHGEGAADLRTAGLNRSAAVDASSEVMQAILRRQNELLAQYGMRERNRRLRAWNSNAIEKWWNVGVKMRRLAVEVAGRAEG